jgi:folylpolyglutamate synthase/dihydropteroate synthase
MLVPKEMQIEHKGGIKAMSDEQIEQAIEAIQTMLAAQAEQTKIIEATLEPTALPGRTEVRQLQRNRSNRLLAHVDAAFDPSDGGEANLSSLSKNF